MGVHLTFCMYTACQEAAGGHPQKVLKNLGITYQHATPQSMGDCWWFWNCENLPDELPNYITVSERDPMKCVGYGLSQSAAEAIRDYKS